MSIRIIEGIVTQPTAESKRKRKKIKYLGLKHKKFVEKFTKTKNTRKEEKYKHLLTQPNCLLEEEVFN